MEERRFYPTDLGRTVDKQLLAHFPDVVNVGFTAQIEDKLDEIASNDAEWKEVMRDFYGPFEKSLEKAEKGMERIEMKPVQTDEKCPKCGSPMGLRENRFGRYLACSAYPNCRTTIPVDRNGQKILPEPTSEVCPNCSKPMVMKSRGRVRFLACTGYPDCRTTFSVDREGKKIVRPKPEPTDFKCNKCERPMLKRFGKRGPFLACSGFPKCRNIKPVPAEDAGKGKGEAGDAKAGAA
jgi:DNA topoisomerase I